jgi:hypothetical protein
VPHNSQWVYWRDTVTGVTKLLSTEDNAFVDNSTISGDGRFVAFEHHDTSDAVDLYDTQTDTLQVVDPNPAGGGDSSDPLVSPDGRYVTYMKFVDHAGYGLDPQCMIWDRTTGIAKQVSSDNTTDPTGSSRAPLGTIDFRFSGDGKTLFFNHEGTLTNSTGFFAPSTDGNSNVYAYNIATGVVTPVSVNAAGQTGNKSSYLESVSADGNRVVFTSAASNLDPTAPASAGGNVFVRDLAAGTTTMISTTADHTDSGGGPGSISADGHYVVYQMSTNIYRKDLTTGAVQQVNVKPDGTPSAYSAVLDAGQVGGPISPKALSADGRYVVFCSSGTDLVNGFTNTYASGQLNVYVRDMTTGVTTLVSHTPAGPTTGPNLGPAGTYSPAISLDGKVVAFTSDATNLTTLPVPNGNKNLYVTTPTPPSITSAASATFMEGAQGSFNVTDTGSPTPTLKISGTLPTGVTFNPMTGVLSGQPAASTAGTYPLTFTASNSVGSDFSQPFTLTVAPSLTITVPTLPSAQVGASYNQSVSGNGGTTPYTFTLVAGQGTGLPAGLVLNSNGSITGMPDGQRHLHLPGPGRRRQRGSGTLHAVQRAAQPDRECSGTDPDAHPDTFADTDTDPDSDPHPHANADANHHTGEHFDTDRARVAQVLPAGAVRPVPGGGRDGKRRWQRDGHRQLVRYPTRVSLRQFR